MEENELIKKWLSDTLDDQALQKFEQSETYASLHRIDRAAQQFKAPDFDVTTNYQNFIARKQIATKSRILPQILKIAAVLAIVFGLGGYLMNTNTAETQINTSVSSQQLVRLPDNSEVTLNAVSALRFHEKSWESDRKVTLDGEAFFKVAKGKKFDVFTPSGSVSVLGTQFNVKNRAHVFAVSCYEGLVRVQYQDKTYQLPAGNALRIANGQVVQTKILTTQPAWTKAQSSFKSVAYIEVIEELERQYGVTIQYDTSISDIMFSGTFVHEDLETALKSITIPLQLQFSVKNKRVIISE